MSDQTQVIPFPKTKRPGLVRVARRIEKDAQGRFYARVTIDRGNEYGRQKPTRTRIRLPGLRLEHAEKVLNAKLVQYELYKHKAGNNPFAPVKHKWTVKEVLEFYLDQGCPKQNGSMRPGIQKVEDERRARELLASDLASSYWDAFTQDDWNDYRRKKQRAVKEKYKTGDRTGDRDVDVQRSTLSSAFELARRNPKRTGVTSNPMKKGFPRFRHSDDVIHCREHLPGSAEEFHRVAEQLEPVLLFQACYTFFTGMRTHEVLELKSHPRNDNDPGFIEYKKVRGKEVPSVLYPFQSQTHKRTAETIDINEALAQVIPVHRKWLQEYYPDSPHAFPSPDNPSKTVDKSSLTNALGRICRRMGLTDGDGRPRKITSHSLRAGYATVRRSQKANVSDITDELGHRSDFLVRNVYAKIRHRLSFLPAPGSGQPVAWHQFLKPDWSRADEKAFLARHTAPQSPRAWTDDHLL